uniref:DUF2231 domain-containing protein n=1 Tax=Flavobacterium sp. TaxID=239 RepID=UPI00404AC9D0
MALFSKKQFFKNVTLFLLITGTLGAIVAYISGSYAGDGLTDGILEEPLEVHEEAAFVTLLLAIIITVIKTGMYYFKYQKAWAKWTSFLLFAVLIGFLARTGFLGGELVFKHGAGIELALPDFNE